MKMTCENCKFWDKYDHALGEGHCRKSHPTTGGWPRTRDIDWCGEFARRDPEDFTDEAVAAQAVKS